MKHFSNEELSRCDGRDSRPAYVAVAGKVYDVTDSFLWKAGRHQVFHDAGRDLTAELTEAPHGADLLERVPCIGVLDPGP
jgi:predicted heme/steroid binding protein